MYTVVTKNTSRIYRCLYEVNENTEIDVLDTDDCVVETYKADYLCAVSKIVQIHNFNARTSSVVYKPIEELLRGKIKIKNTSCIYDGMLALSVYAIGNEIVISNSVGEKMCSIFKHPLSELNMLSIDYAERLGSYVSVLFRVQLLTKLQRGTVWFNFKALFDADDILCIYDLFTRDKDYIFTTIIHDCAKPDKTLQGRLILAGEIKC